MNNFNSTYTCYKCNNVFQSDKGRNCPFCKEEAISCILRSKTGITLRLFPKQEILQKYYEEGVNKGEMKRIDVLPSSVFFIFKVDESYHIAIKRAGTTNFHTYRHAEIIDMTTTKEFIENTPPKNYIQYGSAFVVPVDIRYFL